MTTPLVASNHNIFSLCLVWSLYLTKYVQEGVSIQLWYVHMAWLLICVSVCYWLLSDCVILDKRSLYTICVYVSILQTLMYLWPCIHNSLSLLQPSYNIARYGFCLTAVVSDDPVSLIVYTCHWSVVYCTVTVTCCRL